VIDISTHGEGPGTRFISGVLADSFSEYSNRCVRGEVGGFDVRTNPGTGITSLWRGGLKFAIVDEHQRVISIHPTYADTASQPAPQITPGRPAIQDLVTEDIATRKAQGIAKYGTALQGFNGRDALTDAYQEALDLVQYLRQALYERDGQ
jgi:hypothetical protein